MIFKICPVALCPGMQYNIPDNLCHSMEKGGFIPASRGAALFCGAENIVL